MNPHEQRARAAIELKRWDAAHEAIIQALADEPNSPVLFALRAEVRYRQRQYADAREAARQAIALAPDWKHGYYWLGWSLHAEAAGMMDEIAMDTRAAAKLLAEKKKELVQTAEIAAACDPDDAEGFHLRSAAAHLCDRPEEAIQFAFAGLECNPEHHGCMESLALAQMASKLFDDAENTLTCLLKLDPESPTAHQNMALVALAQERFVDAYDHVRTAIRLAPTEPSIVRLYGVVLQHLHPLARFLLWTANFVNRRPFVLPVLGLCPLVVMSVFYAGKDLKDIPPALGAGAVLSMVLGLWGLWAMLLAETVISFSQRFSHLAPESRARRWDYAFYWVAGITATLALAARFAGSSPYPLLVAGNAIVAGYILLLAQRAEGLWLAWRIRLLTVIPITLQVVPMFWVPEWDNRSSFSLVIYTWAFTALAAKVMRDGWGWIKESK